jgi:hypothetical protein
MRPTLLQYARNIACQNKANYGGWPPLMKGSGRARLAKVQRQNAQLQEL